eukprot:gene17243-22770_t
MKISGWKEDAVVPIYDGIIYPKDYKAKHKSRTKKSLDSHQGIEINVNESFDTNIQDVNQDIDLTTNDTSTVNSIVDFDKPLDQDINVTGKRSRRSMTNNDFVVAVVKPKRIKRDKDEDSDHNDWLCGICELLEADDNSMLILCDGPCKRSYHGGCLKLDKALLETIQNDISTKWFCEDCTNKTHACFICSEKGIDYKDVWKCSHGLCGKYYHQNCINDTKSGYVVPNIRRVSKKVKDLSCFPYDHFDADITKIDVVKFLCPYHFCNNCNEFYPKRKSREEDLTRCIRCPRSYHINCFPPGTRYNATCLICPNQPNDYLPSKVKPKFETTNTEFGWLWDQMPLPDAYPDQNNIFDHHFKLPLAIRDEIKLIPSDYKHLTKLEYDSLPTKRNSLPQYEMEDVCKCIDVCDENCLNRVLNVECCKFTNKITNCNVIQNYGTNNKETIDCSNQSLALCKYSKIEIFPEFERGYGARAVDSIAKGNLVIEYIGEVIDEDTMNERMRNQRKHNPTNHDFYIMELDGRYYVDGKLKGNYSRYINHSCDPNCELQRWVVNSTMRIGIFAIKDIAAGEALSYDYQFDTKEDNIFKCFCQASTCRGSMAPTKKSKHNYDHVKLELINNNNKFLQIKSYYENYSFKSEFAVENRINDEINNNENTKSDENEEDIAVDSQGDDKSDDINSNEIDDKIVIKKENNSNRTKNSNSTNEIEDIHISDKLKSFSINVIDDYALNSLSKKNRKLLLDLGISVQHALKSNKQSIDYHTSRNYISNYLPGDTINEIKNGPLRSTFKRARLGRIFLPRNARVSKDFLKRQQDIKPSI